MRLCRLEEVPDGGSRGFDPWAEGRDTMFVVRRAGAVHAWRNACPHIEGAPMPWRKDEYLNADRSRIVCSAHGAEFDVATGLCLLGPCVGQALEPVRIVLHEGVIHLEEEARMGTPFRRIVTGHDARGRAIIQSDAPPERVKVIGKSGPTFYEVWNTRATPAPIDRHSGEPAEAQLTLAPPPGGTRIRVLDIPPDPPELQDMDAAAAREHFAEVGAAAASTHGGGKPRHPFMHRTESIDYGIVLEGEITLLVDEGETTVRAGDIVIQRGTNHGWANRSGRNCRIAFILIDGKFTDGL